MLDKLSDYLKILHYFFEKRRRIRIKNLFWFRFQSKKIKNSDDVVHDDYSKIENQENADELSLNNCIQASQVLLVNSTVDNFPNESIPDYEQEKLN